MRWRKRKVWIALFVAIVLGTVLVVVRPFDGSSGTHLVWADEFDGANGSAPDPAIWRFATGGDGWGNQELECYTSSRANSALDGHGYLVISARYDPGHKCSDGHTNDYTSARLLTENVKTVQYGKVEVRAKLPVAAGTWPAIWALGSDHATIGWPRSGEIDIAEKIGSGPSIVHGTLHGPNDAGEPYSITAQTLESGTPGQVFHVYEVDWTPDSVSFLIDGRVYSTVDKAQATAYGHWVFAKPFYLLLNLAVGGSWPGPPTSATTWPQQSVIDWVRVYS